MEIAIQPIGKVSTGQDGAIFGDYLFRFKAKGECSVHNISTLGSDYTEFPTIAEFKLDKSELIVPHSNAVVFGTEKYNEDDEFPLLYSNIYNNYNKFEDQMIGVTCVYRITRDGEGFSSQLVQLIEIGFAGDRELWRSAGDVEDIRPYGNFVIDRERGLFIGFVMRDGERTTRYFAFDLPKLSDGVLDERYGVNRVTLLPADIKWQFDTPYHNFIQGAVCRGGIVYSVEGFDANIHPAIRLIDTNEKKELLHHDFYLSGHTREAEFIDFHRDRCIYSDAHGYMFELTFS